MEEILELYTLPYAPAYPLVCFDESCKQLISEVRQPLTAQPGKPERFDYQYKREGVNNLFMFLEFYYTPKHGSWLNMAEIEFSVLNRQCLNRRISSQETLIQEVEAWEQQRNQTSSPVDWQFTTEDARIKLTKLYPSILT
jgi:DDE superfamily endonuclease